MRAFPFANFSALRSGDRYAHHDRRHARAASGSAWGIVNHRLVRFLKDRVLHGVELTLDTLDDPVTDVASHDAFQRRDVDLAFGTVRPIPLRAHPRAKVQ